MKILGIGNALVDVLARIDNDNILEKLKLPKGSMQLIDEERLCILNSAIENIEKSLASGGSASNTITGIAKLGIETGFIGKIGKDQYGSYYKTDLQKYGVKSHLMEVEQASGVATTFISKDGERTFGTYLGAAATLTPEDLNEEVFSHYHYLYIEGYLVQNLNLIKVALKMAKKAGLKIALDLASYNIVEENKEFLLEVIPQYVDILFANQEEIEALLGISPEEAIDKLKDSAEIIVIKVGPKGSWIRRGEEKVFIPTTKITRVDSTGAGDFYAAGFLCGLVKNLPLNVCGEMGTLLAQQVIQVIGAKLEKCHWDEIQKYIPNK